ncbi:hypothetical protein DFJ73DRAFT_773880 [Zopfochytrium polystomum]|nr:hypothetical protein DFJ73DRAFT_773880 [Zopfochytrium polystomum]
MMATTAAAVARSSVHIDAYPTHLGYLGTFDFDQDAAAADAAAAAPVDPATPSNTPSTSTPAPSVPLAPKAFQTVIVLDISGSMGQNVGRLVTTILPRTLELLDYKPTDPLTVVTFESSSRTIETTVGGLQSTGLRAMGGTTMAPAVKLLEKRLKTIYDGTGCSDPLRLLTVSDGEVGDQERTMTEASQLATWVSSANISVNSQLNNSTEGTALDIKAATTAEEMEEAAQKFASLITDNESFTSASITAESSVLKMNPWQRDVTSTLKIRNGTNIFWMTELPSSLTITIGESAIGAAIRKNDAPPNWDSYERIMKQKLEVITQQVKVLKVVNTAEAKEQISQIREYFSEMQRRWALEENTTTDDASSSGAVPNGIALRLLKMRSAIKKRSKSLLQALLEIANDDKVSELNSAQQADYLRSVSVSKNAKGLAKRALKSSTGTDFDAVAREEATAMHKHLPELVAAVGDDSGHLVSFFSQATTLEGIKAVCELVEGGLINDVSVNEIIELLNVVGVACTHTIGEYPDSMSFRPQEVFVGCHVSLSDVLVAHIQGGELKTPGTNKTITTVVPIFDDMRILRFLRTHAPKLLEFTCSIGMRRVIADVGMSFGYTVLAGLWRCIEQLSSDRSDVVARTVMRLAESVPTVVGGYFNHVDKFFDGNVPQPAGKSYNLFNNGITNIIVPVSKQLRRPEFVETDMPRILRALFTFETWQIVRKLYRHVDNADTIVTEIITKLLGIDIEKTRLEPTPLFEADHVDPKFVESANPNMAYLSELQRKFFYVQFLPLLEPVLRISLDKDKPADERVAALQKELPDVKDEDVQRKAFAITFSMKDFALYNVMQALLFRNKADRISEEDSNVVLIEDLGDEAVGTRYISDYVRQAHADRYAADLKAKRTAEETALLEDLLSALCSAKDAPTFISLLRDGKTRGASPICAKIANAGSTGFKELCDRLLEPTPANAIPDRLAKLRPFLLGRERGDGGDDDPIVWNAGNVINFVDLARFEAVWIAELGAEAGAAAFAEVKKTYMSRRRHWYRYDTNRHGHSNSKPSYWAMGYKDMQQMKEQVAEDVYKKYLVDHEDCCRDPTAPFFRDAQKAGAV